MAQNLKEFLADYASGYDAYDAERLAEFFFRPAIFLLRHDVRLMQSTDDVDAFLAAGLEAYRAAGSVDFSAELLAGRRIGDRFALIDVQWRIAGADRRPVMDFRTTYNLVDVDGRWKIALITRHD